MKKTFFILFVTLFSLVSCKQANSPRSDELDAFARMVHEDVNDVRKYIIDTPSDEATSFDVRIKKNEHVSEVYVMSDRSDVSVSFKKEGKLCRIYQIHFKNGEEAQEWGMFGIKTNKRFLKLNFIQE